MCLILEDKITKKCWKDTSNMCMIGAGIEKKDVLYRNMAA